MTILLIACAVIFWLASLLFLAATISIISTGEIAAAFLCLIVTALLASIGFFAFRHRKFAKRKTSIVSNPPTQEASAPQPPVLETPEFETMPNLPPEPQESPASAEPASRNDVVVSEDAEPREPAQADALRPTLEFSALPRSESPVPEPIIPAPVPPSTAPAPAPQKVQKESVSKKPPKLLESIIVDGVSYDCKYKYDDVGIFVPEDFLHDPLEVGEVVLFQKESENEYDANAVMVIDRAGLKQGYLYKGKLQDMSNDFLNRDDPIRGIVTSENPPKLSVWFYKNPLENLESYESKTAKLIKTSKKDEYEDRQDNYSLLDEGDVVDLEYDFDSETYIVSSSEGEIGEVSKGISGKLQDMENQHEFIAIVNELTETDSGTLGASITIYFKPI